VPAHPQFVDDKVLALIAPQCLVHFDLLRDELPRHFPGVQLVAPRDLAHLHELVRRSAGTHRLVLAVGGDGTLFQVLQQLDLEQQALGIIPSGTGNDFATAIGFPKGLRDRLAHLSHTSLQPTDIGLGNGVRYVNSGGFGIDTDTLRLRERSGPWMKKQYNLLFLRVLAAMRPAPVSVNWELPGGPAGHENGRFFWLLAMNSPLIGGGTRIAPRARLDDGLLDMVLIRRVAKLELLRRMPAAIAGRHLGLAMTRFAQVRQMVVEADEPVPYLALDGELVHCGQRRIEFKVQPAALQFLR
jgi:diacylglycerol kinase family enzyme